MREAGHSNELLTVWGADAINGTVASIARPRVPAAASDRMINYTDSITRLMHDLISRVPDLQYIDMARDNGAVVAGQRKDQCAFDHHDDMLGEQIDVGLARGGAGVSGGDEQRLDLLCPLGEQACGEGAKVRVVLR